MPDNDVTLVPAISVAEAPMQFTQRLRGRMYSPLCGLMTQMGLMQRQRGGPRLIVASGDMTGVHVLRNLPRPRMGSYHIGGYGLRPFEAHIRTLGELVERYGAYVCAVSGTLAMRTATAAEMAASGERYEIGTVPMFTAQQYARPGFPFKEFDEGKPLSWVSVTSLRDGQATWIPTQLLIVGYVIRDTEGEPWLTSAVSTGTAAHTDPDRAALNALEEIIQIDAAIGHWHGNRPSVLIQPGTRTSALQRIVAQVCRERGAEPEFHLLPSPDLPGFTVACLFRGPDGRPPALAVGLGIDGELEKAMYKALLEGAGVRGLATWTALQDQLSSQDGTNYSTEAMFDLESNVAFAALPDGAKVAEARFAEHTKVGADDLPPDDVRPVAERVRDIVAAFHRTGKRLFAVDLTAVDIQALGFVVARFWSPDVLPLPLPSAPPAAHPRFEAYGGFRRDDPHPYP